ncbi:GSCFA domain-containing protein [Aliiroseovarius crassostreae]|uniref:GSCFA domain-containing protein n=1 Tax=Aliiroseovarius crassostreae TaxID=154981 RepID=UPI003C7A6370
MILDVSRGGHHIASCDDWKLSRLCAFAPIHHFGTDCGNRFFSVVALRDAEKRSELVSKISECDLIFTVPFNAPLYDGFSDSDLRDGSSIYRYPTISFAGYHPDCGNLNSGKLKSPIGDYHSLIAASAFLVGASVQKTQSMYNSEVYDRLGFRDLFSSEMTRLKGTFQKFQLPFEDNLSKSFERQKMMHTINHPTYKFLDTVAKGLLERSNIDYTDISGDEYLSDTFPDSTIYPVYPDLLPGLPGAFAFKPASPKSIALAPLGLHEFVSKSFKLYSEADAKELENPQLEHFKGIISQVLKDTPKRQIHLPLNRIKNALIKSVKPKPVKPKKKHPYLGLPDYQFWKRSFQIPASEVDPVVTSKFRIGTSDRIATAGSCFAQHLAKRLARSGFNYFIPENAPQGLSQHEASQNNYGVFSCRYANIYTVRQLHQLFDRCQGKFNDQIGFWEDSNGRILDPYRPQIQPGGFSSVAEATQDRKTHLASVKRMFEELDYFVFTMGLTECWVHKKSGAALPVAPGVAGGEYDLEQYEFRNFGYEEILSDLQDFLAKLSEINPRAQVILTVSPVPLAATYEDRHVLVSTTASKSILRAVAEHVNRTQNSVHYFPSYEIITGNYTGSSYFETDLREVRSEGVDHVMRLFEKHCTVQTTPAGETSEHSYLDQIVCEEDLLNIPKTDSA